jgi:hypothetical protein
MLASLTDDTTSIRTDGVRCATLSWGVRQAEASATVTASANRGFIILFIILR